MKRQLGITVDNRVACVVSALVTNNVIVVARNKVGDLAFALVAHWAPRRTVLGMKGPFDVSIISQV